MKTVYERIKEVREKLGISQADFSQRIFVSKSLYGDIEIGKRNVNDRIIFIVSKQFNVNEDWIRTGKGEMFSASPPDTRLEKLLGIYHKLDNSSRACLVEQSGLLLKLQNENKHKDAQ
jgi:transcriptional regulator with XRE-family HTH domain